MLTQKTFQKTHIHTQYRRTYIHKKTHIKREINSNILIIGDINTALTPMDRSSNKETMDLKDTLDQMDLIDISRRFYLIAAKYTLFSSAHGIISRIDHMLSYKSSLSKFKKFEISTVFSDCDDMKLEINYKKKMENT